MNYNFKDPYKFSLKSGFRSHFTLILLLLILVPFTTSGGESKVVVSSNSEVKGILKKEEGKNKATIEVQVERLIKRGQRFESNLDYENAFKEYKEAIKVGRVDYRGYFSLANLQQKIGDLQSAELNFDKAMEYSPTNPLIHNNLAWLYIETGRAVSAEALILEILGKDPGRDYIYYDTLATSYVYMRNFIMARQYFNEAINYMPVDDIQSQLSLYSHIREMYVLTNNDVMVIKIENILKKLELGHPASEFDLGVGGLQ